MTGKEKRKRNNNRLIRKRNDIKRTGRRGEGRDGADGTGKEEEEDGGWEIFTAICGETFLLIKEKEVILTWSYGSSRSSRLAE